MNDRVRQQLRELRIDPDGVLEWPQSGESRGRGLSQHMLLIAVLGALSICILLSTAVVVVAATQRGQPTVARRPVVTSQVAVGALRLDISAPDYGIVATDGTMPAVQWVSVRMSVRNESDSVVVLGAGDVHLVDSHGALFAPTWREPGGAFRDGFAEPQHTLLAVDPLGETQVSLTFVIQDAGPHMLRFDGPASVMVPLFQQ